MEEKNKINIIKLFKFSNFKDKILIFIAIIFSILNGVFQSLSSIIIGKIIEAFINYPKDKLIDIDEASDNLNEAIKENCLYFIYLTIIILFVSYFQMVFWLISAENQCLKIRNQYFKSVISQDISWFDDQSSGDISSRITTDINIIQGGISDKLGIFIQSLSSLISGFVIAYLKSWKLALIMSSIIPCILIFSLIMDHFIKRFTFLNIKLQADLSSISEEVISSIKMILLFETQKEELERYNKNLIKYRKNGINKALLSGIAIGTLFFFTACTYAIGFWYGTKLVLSDDYLISEMACVVLSIIIGLTSLGQTSSSAISISSAQIAALKIFNIIKRKSNINPLNEDGLIPEKINGNIIFNNVGFSYPSRKHLNVLNDLSLIIPAGKTIAFLGSSGCGKSTCTHLINRFYDPDSGSITLDGINIKEYNLNFLRKNIGIVRQEPVLFNATIIQNIAWGASEDDASPSIDDVIEACKLSNAHDFIMKLPNKYDTLVGNKGLFLSGGQKQRIAIARAIIKNPKILLLDEATSALDTVSERLVQGAIDKVSINRTIIVIAHRLSTIKNADIIYVMKDGKVEEKGNHKELIDKNGIYFNLIQAQGLNINNTGIKMKKSVSFNEEVVINEKGNTKNEKLNINKESIIISKSKKINKRSGLISLVKLISFNKYILFFAIIFSMLDGAVFPIYSVILSKIIEELSKPKSSEEIQSGVDFWIIMLLVLGVASFITGSLKYFLHEFVGQDFLKEVKYKMYKSLLYKKLEFFDKEENKIGILNTKLNVESDQIKCLITEVLPSVSMCISIICITFSISFYYGWKLTLACLAVLPLVMFVAFFQTKLLKGLTEKTKRSYEKATQISTESITNIKTITALGREKTFINLFKNENFIPHKLCIKSSFLNGIGFSFSQSLATALNAFGYYYGSKLILNDDYDIRSVIQILTGMSFLGTILGFSSVNIGFFSKAKAAANHFLELINSTQLNETVNNSNVEKINGNIEFKDVCYTYKNRDNIILNSMSFKIPEFKNVAFVGNSGGGKSTILSIIQKLYNIDNGQVLIDNKNFNDVNTSQLRKSISIVGQEPILFNISIKDNISYGKKDATIDEIIEAAKMSNAHDFIMNFPDGYNTLVGEGGSQMSGGQKQRISIARALIRNPSILLLDEATSALDSESEKIVKDALDNASNGRTCISVAHRLSTIKNCDIIFVVYDGKIVEFGNHDDLLKNKSYYYELASKQNLY